MAHKCACFTGAKTRVNINSQYRFNYSRNIKTTWWHFLLLLTVTEKNSWMIHPSFYWTRLHNPLKTPSDGELQFHRFQSDVITWFPRTAGNSAPSLPLMTLNRQRLLWAYLITVHHAASFVLTCSKKNTISKWHIQVHGLWENNLD